jgi:hypothetical protein
MVSKYVKRVKNTHTTPNKNSPIDEDVCVDRRVTFDECVFLIHPIRISSMMCIIELMRPDPSAFMFHEADACFQLGSDPLCALSSIAPNTGRRPWQNLEIDKDLFRLVTLTDVEYPIAPWVHFFVNCAMCHDQQRSRSACTAVYSQS